MSGTAWVIVIRDITCTEPTILELRTQVQTQLDHTLGHRVATVTMKQASFDHRVTPTDPSMLGPNLNP